VFSLNTITTAKWIKISIGDSSFYSVN
jgi:hypothetical protein